MRIHIYVCIRASERNAHKDHPTTTSPLPAIGIYYAERVRSRDYACANFHPFPDAHHVGSPPPAQNHPPGPLCRVSSVSLSLSRHSQRPPLSLTGGSGVCVHRRQSPSIEHFYDSFRLESPSHPADKRAETWWGGVAATAAAAASVRRVQTSTSGLGLVSLVTAPHKGIAL